MEAISNGNRTMNTVEPSSKFTVRTPLMLFPNNTTGRCKTEGRSIISGVAHDCFDRELHGEGRRARLRR
jgi:hypothetical protein